MAKEFETLIHYNTLKDINGVRMTFEFINVYHNVLMHVILCIQTKNFTMNFCLCIVICLYSMLNPYFKVELFTW
jgi:uncharacterized membrane protein